MRVALVTTPPSGRSGILDYTEQLIPGLCNHCKVAVFVQDGKEGGALANHPTRALSSLDPREFDRILYQVGNEQSHAFMLPAIRALGGTVVLHDWVLFDLAVAANPALARGGFAGHLAAARMGGLKQARLYARVRSARRRQRSIKARKKQLGTRTDGEGTSLLDGWHALEGKGCWSSGWSVMRLAPGSEGKRDLCLELDIPEGRKAEIVSAHGTIATCPMGTGSQTISLDIGSAADGCDCTYLALSVSPLDPTPVQRKNGDQRALGAFVRAISLGGQPIDLAGPRQQRRSIELSDARFDLAFNRPVVRHADAFIVHSKWMREQILHQRGAPTPVGIIPHGARPLEGGQAHSADRRTLGLPDDAFLITSFGAIQEHKRPEVLLQAVAIARKSYPNLHLVLAGEDRLERLDLSALIKKLELNSCVTVTGFLTEQEITPHLQVADVCVNLRGPSTGGTSGAIARALGAGRPVIASGAAEQGEWPSACVRTIQQGSSEVSDLVEALIDWATHPKERRAAEQAARAYAVEVLAWPRVGAMYADILERMPGPHSTRKSLIAGAIAGADERRKQRT